MGCAKCKVGELKWKMLQFVTLILMKTSLYLEYLMVMEVNPCIIIGPEVANYVKAHFLEVLVKEEAFKSKDYPTALKLTFIHIDELLRTSLGQNELIEISKKLGSTIESNTEEQIADNVGCTACVALITKSEIFVANSGDSRCVLCKDGKPIPLSKDHKPTLDEERNRIEAAGGVVIYGRVNGILNLSRTIGDFEFKNKKELGPEKQMVSVIPDIKVEPIDKDTKYLILACDGIWDCYTNEKAIEVLNQIGRASCRARVSSPV